MPGTGDSSHRLPGGGRSPAKLVSHWKFPVFGRDQGTFLGRGEQQICLTEEIGLIINVLQGRERVSRQMRRE
jgi:hypothetical protein